MIPVCMKGASIDTLRFFHQVSSGQIMNYSDIVKFKFCERGLKMTTSTSSETTFLPVRYENYLEDFVDTRGWVNFIHGEIFAKEYKKGALAIRVESDPRITVCEVNKERKQSLVHIAAEALNEVALKVFIKKGHICDVPDADGNTPLMTLIQKYAQVCIDQEETYRSMIESMIKKGARLSLSNHEGETALSLIFTKAHEKLFFLNLDQPWADVIIDHFSKIEEPSSIVLERLNYLLVRPGFRTNLIHRILKVDFLKNPKGLCKLLELSVRGAAYNPPWLAIMREDQSAASVALKLDVLKNAGFLEPLKRNYQGLNFEGKYPQFDPWFQRNKPTLTTALSAPIMMPPPGAAPLSPRPIPAVRHAISQRQMVLPTNRRLVSSAGVLASEPPPLPPEDANTSATASTSSASASTPSSPTPPVRHQSRQLPMTASTPSIPIPARIQTEDSETPVLPERGNSWSYSATFAGGGSLRRRGNTDESQRSTPVDRKNQEKSNRSKMLKFVVSEEKEEQDYAKELLTLNPTWVNQSFEGTFLIFKAIEAGRVAMTKFLLDKGAILTVWTDAHESPLHVAVKNVTVEVKRIVKIIGYLLENKADLKSKNQSQDTPLDLVFDRGDPEILEPFLAYVGSLEERIKQWIADGHPQQENEVKCILLAIERGNVSLKVVLTALLQREFSERSIYMQKLLDEVLKICEVMDSDDMGAFSSDTTQTSLDIKIASVKKSSKLYKQMLHLLFQTPNSSTTLLKSMLSKKDPKVIVDYNLIFADSDKKSRTAKIQVLMDLKIIPSTRKANFIATTEKPLELVEAFDFGFVSLFPVLDDAAWPDMLEKFEEGRKTLNELQILFLSQKLPKDAPRVKEIVEMLFKKDFHKRSDPFVKGPFEIMLELAIANCKNAWTELLILLKEDTSETSRRRKLAICKVNPGFECLESSLGKGEFIPPPPSSSPPKGTTSFLERESFSSSASSSSSSSRTHKSKSPPGSGTSTPRGSSKK